MKKYLLLGTAVIFASGFGSAKACDNLIAILNGSGSPLVVVGNAVQIDVIGPADSSLALLLDGNVINTFINQNTTLGLFPTTITVPFGSHTLETSGTSVSCPAEFSAIPTPVAPGTPTLSSSRAIVSGQNYTLSWTVPSGPINHYTLHEIENQANQTNIVLSATTTSDTFGSSSKPNVDNTFDFTVRACATADESICGPWSNTVEVDVITGGTQ